MATTIDGLLCQRIVKTTSMQVWSLSVPESEKHIGNIVIFPDCGDFEPSEHCRSISFDRMKAIMEFAGKVR